MIALPKTIDNDINNTYVSVGFSTATKVAAKEISNIISTAKSHSRIMVIEVMGRGAGYIALTAGLASGVDAIIVPEIKCDIKKLISKIKSIYDEKGYAIVVISEGVEFDKYKYKNKKLSDTISRKNYGGVSNFLANQLKQAGFDAKSVILGHTQRGGCASVEDRILGIKFGAQAVNLIHNNDTGYLLGTDGSKIVKTKLSKIKTTTRNLTSDSEDITVAKNLGIFIGE